MTSPKLTTTVFQTDPDENLVAKDVYETATSGEVVNSWQDKVSNDSLEFGSLGAALRGFSIKGLIDSARSAASNAFGIAGTVKNSLAMAAKASAAINAIKKGNFSAALGQVSGLAKGASLESVMPALRAAQRSVSSAQSFINNPSLSGAMRLGGSALGSEGAALTRLGSTINRNMNQLSSLDRAVDTGNLSSILNASSRLAGGAQSFLGDFDKATSIDFDYAASKVIGSRSDYSSGKTSLDALLGMSEAYSGKPRTDTKSDTLMRSALMSGTAFAAANKGVYDIFSTTAKFDTMEDLIAAKTSGTFLAQEALKTGSYDLLTDVLKTPVGKSVMQSIPQAARALQSSIDVSSVKEKDYAIHYELVSSTMTELDPDWKYDTGRNFDIPTSNFTDARAEATASIDTQKRFRTAEISTNPSMEVLLEAKVLNTNRPFDKPDTEWENHQEPDEAFLLLGARFKGESVKGALQEEFPEFYEALPENEFYST